MLTKLLAVVASLASAVVVRDAAEFRVELARGASSIDLAADIYLEGEQLNVTSPCVVDGRGNGLLQAPGVRLFRASAGLELRDVTDGVETTTTQVLFGDLIAAVEESIDGDAETLSRDYKPGTNAQRHRLHHAKHGHASGGLGKLMRRHSSHALKRSGSTLQRSGSATSRSDEENVQAPGGQRPPLNRSRTWRTSAPSSVEI